MDIFFNRSKLEILQKTQENLELSQKNLERVSFSLGYVPDGHKAVPDTEVFTEQEKRKAAYALNLCMISVSQIIDYNDIYILEQEYDAILNNLNIEEMPKDEALLMILKQLLDTITYFRIQEGDKEFLEKDYQQKMKDAIWSAVPNIGMLVAGGSLMTMGLSLASQVGIGYMNYRRTKAQTNLEQEKAMWQMQRSALEQFNGLRRELFDTAWRLADKYQFQDTYRITEKQIFRYNEILLDDDYLRRYERLEYMRDRFEAYPPFWYYLGNAANMVWQDEKYEESIRTRYLSHAMNHFQRFLKQTEEDNILRYDQLLASCALEYFDLLQITHSSDYNDEMLRMKLDETLSRAIKAAGNSYDVLELCAFSYIKIGNFLEAAKMLRMLINEDYNVIVNAQFLSCLYVNDFIHKRGDFTSDDYSTLCTRVNARMLFPMPNINADTRSDFEQLQTEFLASQKILLLEKYAIALEEIITRYTVLFNRSIPFPDGLEHPDSDYYDNADVRQKRKNGIRQKFAGSAKRNDYIHHVANSISSMLDALDALYSVIREFPGVQNADKFRDSIEERIRSHSKELLDLHNKANYENLITVEDVDKLFTFTFALFTKPAFVKLVKDITNQVYVISGMEGIAHAESEIRRFCGRHAIRIPEMVVQADDLFEGQNETKEVRFGIGLLSDIGEKKGSEFKRNNEMLSYIKEHLSDLLVSKNHKIEIYVKGENRFDNYITHHQKDLDRSKILMVINDTSNKDEDWLLRTDGMQRYYRMTLFKLKDDLVAYKDIKWGDYLNNALDIGKIEFYKECINMKKFSELINKLASIEARYAVGPVAMDKHQYIPDLVKSLTNILFSQPQLLNGLAYSETEEVEAGNEAEEYS